MLKIKVLWLSNKVLTESPDTKSGTWLSSLAPELIRTNKVELGNISIDNVKNFEQNNCCGITQWILPKEKLNKNGLPSQKTIKIIQNVVKEFNPDIIQVWGIENYWGLLTARGLLQGKVLLNIQGIISSVVKTYYGGLTNKELLQCVRTKELVKPKYSIFWAKYKYTKAINREIEIIKNHKFFAVQSEWVKAHISAYNNNFVSFKTERTLRSDFTNCHSWDEVNINPIKTPTLFMLSLYPPYKGLHVLIRAMGILKNKYPNIVLNIAGLRSNPGIKSTGYEKWIRKMIKNFNLNINWLGPLTAPEIVKQMQNSSVFVHPSFVESYSVAVAEAMMVGTPSVISFAGALPELAKHKESALYFPTGDHIACASNIERYISDFTFSRAISQNAREIAIKRNNPELIVKNQISIYRSIID